MKTGFNKLDEIIDINKSSIILIADNTEGQDSAKFSGDIANNIVLHQKNTKGPNYRVLELVTCRKEYLIKRMIINQCNVDYNSWCTHSYTDEEFIKIGKTINELIETTTVLPDIEEINHRSIKEIKQRIIEYCEYECIDDFRNGLIILDSYIFTNHKKDKSNIKECAKWLKVLRKTSQICNAPILITYSINYKKNDSSVNINDIEKELLKYIDTTIIINEDYNLTVHIKDKIQNIELKYLSKYRRFNEEE